LTELQGYEASVSSFSRRISALMREKSWTPRAETKRQLKGGEALTGSERRVAQAGSVHDIVEIGRLIGAYRLTA
jgi:hypothetical protein